MRRYIMKQKGQGLSEYLVIVGLIAVASIAAVGFLGGTMRSQVAAVAIEIAGQDGSVAMIFAEGNALQASAQAAASKHLGNYVGQNATLDGN
ncbi:MAG: hypothetical protein O3A68_08930 [Proteobacteria bacterium]|nr:hypothetical protein [Pseudomonadota bacterium]